MLGAGVRLRVHEHGDADAPSVVLVHGYPDTSSLWAAVARRLARDHHVVTYDVRGAGASERPAGTAAYDLRLLVADLAAVVAATVPDGPVHLVGHDWGAIQGFAAVGSDADLAPDVASFTAVSAPSFDVVGHWVRATLRRPTPAGLAAVAGQLRRSWYVGAFQVPVLPELVWRTVLGPRWSRGARRRAAADPSAVVPAPTLARDGAVGVRLYRANLGRALRPRPQRWQVPVRVLAAARDPFVSPRVFDRLGDHGDDVAVELVDTGSHWLPRTHADRVAAAVGVTVTGASPT